MSPRAASWLETLGFTQVFDYVAGKADWMASGLPIDGDRAHQPRAGDVARQDVPTCGLDDSISDVRQQLERSEWELCFVLADGRVVGSLQAEELANSTDAPARELMQLGPSTTRPNTSVEAAARSLQENDSSGILVTTLKGQLVGYLRREDADRVAEQQGG